MAAPMLLNAGAKFLNGNLLLSNSDAIFRVIFYAGYAKKPMVGVGSGAGGKPGKGAAVPQKRHQLVPETDPVKLTRFLSGGNILKEGGADPELRPHSEYPDWLWTLRVEREPVPLEELEFDTWAYWKRLHKLNRKREMLILKNKYRYHKF